MKTSSHSLLHIADLRTIGGVERMLIDFIKSTPDIEHHLLLKDKKIHPNLEEIHTLVASVHSIKHLCHVLPLPKALRKNHCFYLIESIHAEKILIWNQVTDLIGINTPCVYYEHGSAWYQHTPEQIRSCFGAVKKVIAVSQAAKRMLQLSHHVENDITVLHNTLRPDINVLETSRTSALKPHSVILGVACRLVPIKAVPLIVLTIKELREQGIDARAKIAGTGEQLNIIQNLINKHQLQNEIELLGLVEDMAKFYQEIDCYMCTSVREPFGLAGLDAMAYGLPVIATNIDGLPEVITHEFNGFCIEPTLTKESYQEITQDSSDFCQYIYYPTKDDIGDIKFLDPKILANYVKKLITDPECYTQMSKNALHTTQSAPKFDNLCKDILQVLKNAS